jgi:hypothetical protein
MARLSKIIKGKRYQLARFNGQWYVVNLDSMKFVYGPFLRRETAVARLSKLAGRMRLNPKSKIKKREALWDVMDAVQETRRASDSGLLDLSEQKRAWRDAISVARKLGATELEIKDAEKEGKHNPKWTPPFAKRKRKRLGVLYQKAFQKFSKENPRRPGVLIYGRVLKIFAEKTEGPYKGQQFVHTFQRGAIMVGMPDGTLRISHP